jgi:medium-chain acyl-[acyl-carrier-protein] hydrolase
MKESLAKRFPITSYDINPGGKARLTSLANFFQEVAYQHAGRLGFGYHDLMHNQTFWVLSRMKIKVLQYPRWDEEIRVETWPRGLDKLFAMRDFRIFSNSGRVTGMASTAWLIVDGKTRRPVRPPERLEQYSIGQDKPYEARLQKIILPEGMVGRIMRRVAWSDLDVVGHVNNVKYIEWCIDATGPAGLDRTIATFGINFMHESLFSDEIEIQYSPAEDREVFFLARRSGDNREIFRAHLVWDHSPAGTTE